MKKFVTILLGGVFLVGMAVTATAEHGQHQRGNPLERLQSKLNLTPEQVERLKPTFEAMQQRHKAQREEFKSRLSAVLTPEQRAKMDAAKGDGERHRGGFRDLNLSDEQKATLKGYWQSQHSQMEQERTQINSQLQATLTPEQLTKYQEMKAHWGQHRGGGHRGEGSRQDSK